MISMIEKNIFFADHLIVNSTIIRNLFFLMIFTKDWTLKMVLITFQNVFEILINLERYLFLSFEKCMILTRLAESTLDLSLNNNFRILRIHIFHHFCLNALFASCLTTASHDYGHFFPQVKSHAARRTTHVRSTSLLLFLHIDI